MPKPVAGQSKHETHDHKRQSGVLGVEADEKKDRNTGFCNDQDPDTQAAIRKPGKFKGSNEILAAPQVPPGQRQQHPSYNHSQ